jgi:hypothetical protein
VPKKPVKMLSMTFSRGKYSQSQDLEREQRTSKDALQDPTPEISILRVRILKESTKLAKSCSSGLPPEVILLRARTLKQSIKSLKPARMVSRTSSRGKYSFSQDLDTEHKTIKPARMLSKTFSRCKYS